MVCRHWKSKGWCRLGSSCKFQHPEHKRGVAGPGMRTTLSLTEALCNDGREAAVAAAWQKKKKSKAKSAKDHKEETLGPSVKVAAPTFNEQGILCAPDKWENAVSCIPTVQLFARPSPRLE